MKDTTRHRLVWLLLGSIITVGIECVYYYIQMSIAISKLVRQIEALGKTYNLVPKVLAGYEGRDRTETHPHLDTLGKRGR